MSEKVSRSFNYYKYIFGIPERTDKGTPEQILVTDTQFHKMSGKEIKQMCDECEGQLLRIEEGTLTAECSLEEFLKIAVVTDDDKEVF